jgi:hypothetical protein
VFVTAVNLAKKKRLVASSLKYTLYIKSEKLR